MQSIEVSFVHFHQSLVERVHAAVFGVNAGVQGLHSTPAIQIATRALFSLYKG